jgi:predicted phage terminase large subunit-like protein
MRAEGNRIVNGVGKYAEDPRPEGELLCPKLLNEQQVAEIEAAMGSLRAAGQLQQRPAPPGGALIKESHFRYFWEETDKGPDGGEAVRYVLRDHEGNERRIWKAQCSFWFQTIDTAMEIGQDNDYTVVLTACFTPPPVCTLVQNVMRERVEVPRQFTILMEQRSRFPEVKLQAVEQAASGRGLIQEGRVRGTPFHPLKTGGKDKAARAIAMVTAYENGMIYHKANAPWLAAFEDELLVFPSGEHDDQWDTMAYAGMLMQQHCFTQQTSEGQVVCWPPPPGREEEELPEPRPGMSLAEKLTGRRPGQARFEEEVPWWNR